MLSIKNEEAKSSQSSTASGRSSSSSSRLSSDAILSQDDTTQIPETQFEMEGKFHLHLTTYNL